MSSEWLQVTLGDLVQIQHGWPFKSEFFLPDDGRDLPVVVAIGNFEYTGGFRFGSTTIKRYSGEYPPEYRLVPGEILLVMTCQTAGGEILGIPARIPNDGVTYLHNQRLGRVRICASSTVHDGFLYWLFLSTSFNQHLVASATGTKILHTAPSRIESFTFFLPPIAEQKAIASALDAVNDRIALLRETNATLEAIAQALFKSWFVDFDPVHTKARGEPPQGMDDTTAALFPDSFEESELGMIPKGWKVGELQDLLVLQRGFDLPASKRVDGEFPLVAASGPNGTHNIAMARAPGIVTGRSGVLGKVFLVLEDYWPLNTTLWVKEFKRATPSYAYEIMRRLDFASFNAGSAVPTLNRNHVHSLKYLLPPSDLIQAFESIAILQHQRAFANSKQAQTLAQLRDTLLPKLISGQLRLPEAQVLLAEEMP